jgi:phytoene dehydrogenase-like protein
VKMTNAAERGWGDWRFTGIWLAAALGMGCQLFGQDPARCEQSVATVRQAIGFKDFASARTWREYTWKVCDERGVVATLDKEIVDAEAAVAAEAAAAKKKAATLAQDRINAAQKIWRGFDAETPTNRNEQGLDAARKSAMRLESGLTPTFAQQLRKYNEGEYQKRLAALKR